MTFNGKIYPVPYSSVGNAVGHGWRMDPASLKKYFEDYDARNREARLNPWAIKPDFLKRAASEAISTLSDTAKGLYHGVVEGPQNPTEEMENKVVGPISMRAIRMGIMPQIEQAKQAIEDFKKGGDYRKSADFVSDEEAEHRRHGLGHALAAVTPFWGPFFASAADNFRTNMENFEGAKAIGGAAGNAATAVAPEVAGKVLGFGVKAAPKMVRSVAEAVTKTTPSELKNLAKEKLEANRAAETKHGIDTANKESEATKSNKEVKESHAKAKADVEAHNKLLKERHAKELADIEAHNKEIDRQIAERQALEQEYSQIAEELISSEKEVNKRAVDKNSANWAAWRQASEGFKPNVDRTAEAIENASKTTPEIKSILSSLEETNQDIPSEQVEKLREETTQRNFRKPYSELNDLQKAAVDNYVSEHARANRIPLTSDSLRAASLQQLHEWVQSVRSALKSMGETADPVKKQALREVLDALSEDRDEGSLAAGSYEELQKAKKSHREKEEAFGYEKPPRRTVGRNRLTERVPKILKQEESKARVDAARVVDKNLADLNEKAKELKDKLAKTKDIESLVKEKKQPVAPPSLTDTRPGYLLKEPTAAPVYAMRDNEGNLFQWDGQKWIPAPKEGIPYQLNPTYENPAIVKPFETGKEEEGRAKQEVITPESYSKHKESNVKKAPEVMRNLGVRRGFNSLLYTIPSAIMTAIAGHLNPATAAETVGIASTSLPLTILGSQALASLLEKPEVVSWVSKVTDRDIAQFNKLPPEEKAVFSADMAALAKAAKAKKIAISPALSAFIAGAAASQNKKSPSEVKKEAEEKQSSEEKKEPPSGGSASVRKPMSPAEVMRQAEELYSGFQNAGLATMNGARTERNPRPYTHVYDPETDSLVPA